MNICNIVVDIYYHYSYVHVIVKTLIYIYNYYLFISNSLHIVTANHNDNTIEYAEKFICDTVTMFFCYTLIDSDAVEPLPTEERSSASDSSDSEEGEMTNRARRRRATGVSTSLSEPTLPLPVSGQ